MRVAISLSGYFRLYEHLLENFYTLLINPIKEYAEVDIFFSTWNKLNSSECFSVKHGNAGWNKYPDFNKEEILKSYAPKKYIIGDFEREKNKFNILNYDKTLDTNTLHKDIHNNGLLFCLTQYYHRFLANQLKQEYEKENDFKYDLVISMRPDLFFLTPFNITKINKEKLSLRTIYNDAFLVSSSEMDDKISALFPNIQRIVDKYKRNKVEWFELYCPEWWLENHYDDIGVTMEQRAEIGEDLFWYYPRSLFLEFCYEIYKKTNQAEKISYPIDYFKKLGLLK